MRLCFLAVHISVADSDAVAQSHFYQRIFSHIEHISRIFQHPAEEDRTLARQCLWRISLARLQETHPRLQHTTDFSSGTLAFEDGNTPREREFSLGDRTVMYPDSLITFLRTIADSEQKAPVSA